MKSPFRSHEYDLVVIGGGCAGLSLLTRLINSGWTKGRRILLLEKDTEKSNDRTWCFWEAKPGFFEHLVYRKWNELAFYGLGHHAKFPISPYTYKMIRGIDFYRYCMHELAAHSEIEIVSGFARDINKKEDQLNLNINDQSLTIRCPLVFSSLIPNHHKNEREIKLLQHFKGWVVQTEHPAFDPAIATFMDFRIPQEQGTSFVYVLPFSQTEALVEYTLFSRTILEQKEYEEGLKNYMTYFVHSENYEIVSEEFGVIPMTSRNFDTYRDGIYYIGTAGGQTKASSGYTFRFIQEHTEQIVQNILAGGEPKRKSQTPSRFRFYDNTLLNVLYYNRLPGQEIFSRLFRKNDPREILAFLDNKTNLLEEFKILASLPTTPFLKAALSLTRK